MSTRTPVAPALYGIGNPLMDIIVRAPAGSPEALGVSPGSMNLVDNGKQREAQRSGTIARRLAGGSCANTVRATQWLLKVAGSTASVAFTGGVGHDSEGDAFEELLDTEGVIPLLARKSTPTGSSVIVVTPDSQRTMFTYLGACRELETSDISIPTLDAAYIFHLTGYMWDTPNQEVAAKSAALEARRGGTLVSFDIADCFVVERYRDSLLEWIPGSVDYLFANEAEMAVLTGAGDSRAEILAAAQDLAPTVVMKIGADGCIFSSGGSIAESPAIAAEPLDTTGAGDAFAGGFIFALIQRQPLEVCAAMANRLAGSVVMVDGCDYNKLDPAAVAASFADFR